MSLDYSPKPAPKILWSGEFLDGKLVIVSMPEPYTVFFKLEFYDGYYEGEVVYKPVAGTHPVDKILEAITKNYSQWILDNRDTCKGCGEVHDDSKAILH